MGGDPMPAESQKSFPSKLKRPKTATTLIQDQLRPRPTSCQHVIINLGLCMTEAYPVLVKHG